MKVTSPKRSTIQNHAGQVVVTGTVTANRSPVSRWKVLVNGVQATLNADGTFNASIVVKPGATR
ncbi:MAG: hypothetical protein IPQ07_20705 [Myxococcales bacterium]|nr:hypothetical protein [Myxococcales bacterium]